MPDHDMEDWVDVVAHRRVVNEPAIVQNDRPSNCIPERDVHELYESVKKTAEARLAMDQPVFRVPTDIDLYQEFLSQIENPASRQAMNCHCCRQFTRRAGSWAIVDTNSGKLVPLAWDSSRLNSDGLFHACIQRMEQVLGPLECGEKIEFTTKNETVGAPLKGNFEHMSITIPPKRVQRKYYRGFKPASTDTSAAMLDRILEDNSPKEVQYAASLVTEDRLPYASEHKAAISWLCDATKVFSDFKGDATARRNLLKHYAASAFIGCLSQLRNGVLSELLSSIAEGLPFTQLEQQWSLLTRPDNYMRPSELPTTGQVDAAERVFKELGYTEEDLRRRYCGWQDVPQSAFLYMADIGAASRSTGKSQWGGIFANLRPQNSGSNAKPAAALGDDVPPKSISFARFAAEVLPHAASVEYQLQRSIHIFFLISGLEGSKPLMQWHNEQNKVSWYTQVSPINLPSHGLKMGPTKVKGICAFPHMWPELESGLATAVVPYSASDAEAFKHRRHGIQYLIILEDCKEPSSIDLCLFPQFMTGNLHGARRVIEAYSKEKRIEAHKNGEFVGGVCIGSELSANASNHEDKPQFRITKKTGEVEWYKILLFA